MRMNDQHLVPFQFITDHSFSLTTLLTFVMYTQEVYTEFHGMLGEAKDVHDIALGLVLSKSSEPNAMKPKDVLSFLKIIACKPNDHSWNCPFYIGPVTIAVAPLQDVETSQTLLVRLFNWLIAQPSSRPHFKY